MFGKQILTAVFVAAVVLALLLSVASAQSTLTPNEQLGKSIFNDTNLSLNNNESCATCHGPAAGWTGPLSDTNAHGAVYQGSIAGAFGNRKPPSAAYATLSPIFHMDKKGLFVGGNFWDGRATGEKLGNPAADQAQFPFLNPMEQALDVPAEVVKRVCDASYADLFEEVWGAEVCELANADRAYDDIALSIAAYESSTEVNAFTSKFDYSFKGMAHLTQEERKGYALFQGKGGCKGCHLSNGPNALFTDFTYDNLGVPKNPENPVYDYDPTFIDPGLGGILATLPDYEEFAEENYGMQKVPTLRNVDLRPSSDFVKAYAHNGYFKSLYGIVHFYNTRDVLDRCSTDHDYTEAEALAADCWPAPEVSENVNTEELGNLGLTEEEENAIVDFLKTLSDGYMP